MDDAGLSNLLTSVPQALCSNLSHIMGIQRSPDGLNFLISNQPGASKLYTLLLGHAVAFYSKLFLARSSWKTTTKKSHTVFTVTCFPSDGGCFASHCIRKFLIPFLDKICIMNIVHAFCYVKADSTVLFRWLILCISQEREIPWKVIKSVFYRKWIAASDINPPTVHTEGKC